MTPLVALACATAGLASGLLVAGTVLGVAHWRDAHRRQLPVTMGGWRVLIPRPSNSTQRPPPTR